jgi:nitrogen fixation NifU-like protein
MKTTELADLYQELIIDHSLRPRNLKPILGARSAEGFNPLCGDRVTVFVRMQGEVVVDASFQGEGCAISKASASLMTESIKGKTRADIASQFTAFHDLVTGVANPGIEGLGKLAAFSGLREFPMRVKCGTLPWHTLRAAMENTQEG